MSKPTLARDLGTRHAAAIVVGTIIGSGIFLVPTEMMQAVGSAALVYVAWMVGGALSLAGAITYAELGAMKPQAGGEYVYIRDAYGPAPAFLYGWTWFAIAKPASIATLVVGLVRILGTFPALDFLNHVAIVRPLTITYGQLVAVAAAALMTGLNYIGIKRAGDFQVVFTLLKIVIIVAIGLMAFTASDGTWHNFATIFSGAKGGFAGFMAALIAALWAYDGWNDLNMVSGEIHNPGRAIPIALIVGVGVVAALYMLTNAAVQYVLPAASIAASQRPASDATAVAVGAWGAAIVSAGNGVVDPGVAERHGDERRAGAVRDVARRILLQGDGRGASAVPHAVGGADGAAGAVDRAAAVCRQLPAVVLAGDFRGVVVLHDRCQHGVRAATQRTRCGAAVSDVGISGGAGAVHRGRSGAAVLHLHREHSKFRVGRGGDSGWAADLLVVCEEEEATGELATSS